jgi:hypothetical protein
LVIQAKGATVQIKDNDMVKVDKKGNITIIRGEQEEDKSEAGTAHAGLP